MLDQHLSGTLPTILHVVNSLSGGGTERHLLSLLHRFDHQRMRHVVVTLRDAGDLTDRLPDHVACRPLFATNRDRATGLRLAALARRYHASLIHARNTGVWLDAILAKLLAPRIRLILGFHGLDSGSTFCKRTRLKCRLGTLAGANFATVSHAGRVQLMEQGGIPGDRIHVLTNGIELDRFQFNREETRGAVRAELNMHPDDFVIGAVGSLTTVKRFDILLRAMAEVRDRIPKAKAILMGDGPLMTDLRKLATDLQIADRIHFCGWREDVPRLLTACDLFASTSDSEGMSNAILEAMASGLPIVATDVADHRSLLEQNQCGLIFLRGSHTDLAQHIVTISGTNELRDRFSRAAQSYAASFAIQTTARNYENLYGSLIPQANRPIAANGNYRPVTASLVPVTTS